MAAPTTTSAASQAVHDRLPHVTIELLSSDLAGDDAALRHLLDDIPLAVFAHNVECVPRLDRLVRDPRASFEQSLQVLRRAKELRPDLWTKSSIMVGLGETDDEVTDAMRQLRDADVDMLTLGQYLAPGRPGERYLAGRSVRARRSSLRRGPTRHERWVFARSRRGRSCEARIAPGCCWNRQQQRRQRSIRL